MILYPLSQSLDPVFDQLHQLLHLVFAVLAVVVLEVEVLSHQLLQYGHIQQMAQLDPLLPVPLIDAFLTEQLASQFRIILHQRFQWLFGLPSHFVDARELVAHNGLLLDQEMLHILEGRTADEVFPILELVRVLPLADHLRKFLIVSLGGRGDSAKQFILGFDALATAQLVHDGKQEDDLVPLVQQEESVELDFIQDPLVFSHGIDLAVILNLLSLHSWVVLIGLDILP